MADKTKLVGGGYETFVTPGTQEPDGSRRNLMIKSETVTRTESAGQGLIDTVELLSIINEARREFGEPPITHNKFIAKVARELEGEFYPEIPKPSTARGGRPTVAYGLTNDQAMLVSMRESKAVRRSALAKLKARHQPVPVQRELSTMEILQIAMASEQGRLAAEERADHAERTKSQISRKREASALGKLSAVTRRCRDLEEQLGESVKHATITRVEKATGRKGEFKFAPLRLWCRDKGVEARDVPDERYGSVKAWPAEAWLAVYGIDLKKLAGGGV
ncbi:TPA: ORF6N domain-containing protein [Citrobacter koseri]